MEDEKHKNNFYMKQQLLRLRTLVAVMMCALMGLTFAACSDDDDDPSGGNDELLSIVVGAWEQDGDDDIIEIKSNGTGAFYENAADFEASKTSSTFNWKYSDGLVTVTANGQEVVKMRTKSVEKNKIVWNCVYPDGSSEVWTWTRHFSWRNNVSSI